MTETRSRGAERILVWGLPAVLAVLALAPVLFHRGYALVGDMVFVPEQPWKPRWIGADGSVPRAVPTDAVTWALGTVLPGDVVQKVVLFVPLVLAGAGTALLTRDRSRLARAAAIVFAMWNPFVYERLAIGHWALLVGYAMLPWIVVGANRLLARETGGWRAVVWPLVLAAWTSPTGGVLAATTLLVLLLRRPRLLVAGLSLTVIVNLPWLVPGWVNASPLPADSFGVQAFAARADTPWGVLGSVASLGGIWKESVVAPGRGVVLLSGVSLALSLAAVAALVAGVRRRRPGPRIEAPLLSLAAVGLTLAVLPTFGAGEWIVEHIVTQVPGGGILRDSQKWIALAVPGLCCGIAAAADSLSNRLTEHDLDPRPFLVGVVALPLLVLPGLAWGLAGKLEPYPYPREWKQVRQLLTEAGAADDRLVVLPFGLYRRFDWNGGHAVLDPMPRFLPGDVVVDDALVVAGGTVGGEDPLAEQIRRVADDPAKLDVVLRDHGVRWVVAHADHGTVAVPVPDGTVVHQGNRLVVVDLGTTGGSSYETPRHVGRWIALDLGVLASVLAMMLPFGRWRGYSRRRE